MVDRSICQGIHQGKISGYMETHIENDSKMQSVTLHHQCKRDECECSLCMPVWSHALAPAESTDLLRMQPVNSVPKPLSFHDAGWFRRDMKGFLYISERVVFSSPTH